MTAAVRALERARVEATEEKAAAEEKIKTIDKMLALSGVKKSPKVRRARTSGEVSANVSKERVDQVWAEIVAGLEQASPVLPDVPGSFTVPAIADVINRKYDAVSKVVQVLHSDGRLRQVGRVKQDGERGLGRMVYAVRNGGDES
jgi:hypothetical protein